MVERAIGEMVGSDRVRPIDYMRTLVNDEGFFNQSATEQLSESTPSCAQKSLDNAVIVRDGRKVRISDIWGFFFFSCRYQDDARRTYLWASSRLTR
jgi:hypothetical protein